MENMPPDTDLDVPMDGTPGVAQHREKARPGTGREAGLARCDSDRRHAHGHVVVRGSLQE